MADSTSRRIAPKLGAASFSVGMPNFVALYALNASLRYLEGIGVSAIARHAGPLVDAAYTGLVTLGLQPLAPRQPGTATGILAFKHPASESLHRALEAKNIHVMHHAGRIRIALHGYNTPQDVDHLLAVLGEALTAVG